MVRTRAGTVLATALKGIPSWQFEKKRDPSFNFLSDPHEYHLKERRLWSPSGTFLQVGYVDDRYYTEESRYRGQYVHRATHLIDEGDPDIWKTIYAEATHFLPFIEAYCEFKEVYKFKPRMREIPIYCPAMVPIVVGNITLMVPQSYGVTPDGEGKILDGDDAIVELKTGTMMWWTAVQTAAQDIGISAFDLRPIFRRRFGVELKKNGKFRVKEFTEEDDYHLWLANLKTVQKMGQPPPKLTVALSY